MSLSITRLIQGGVLTALAVFVMAQPVAPAAGPGTRAPVSIPVELAASLDNGSTVYDSACVACHGETGEGGQGGGPALTNTPLSLSQIMLIVNGGRNTMPAFSVLTDQELLDISTFVKNSL